MCHLHWSQVTKKMISIFCFGSWGPTQARGRPKLCSRQWVLPTPSNINQSAGQMIYNLAHKNIHKVPLRCSLDSQTEDVNNLMLQAWVQTLTCLNRSPRHFERDREQSVFLWLPEHWIRGRSVKQTEVETDTPSSNRQALLDTQDTPIENKAISIIIHFPLMLSIIHC